MPTPFFFSYAHNDAYNDAQVQAFFTQVNKRVRFVTGLKTDGFIDKDRLQAGEEWKKAVVEELRAASAIVCLYSPSYFQSVVCGQELQVFLERRLQYMRLNPGKRPSNIIPVAWQPADVSLSLPDIQRQRPETEELADQGVWLVGDSGQTKEFEKVAHEVAKRVKEALKTPLPDLNLERALGGFGSAFAPPPLPPAEIDAAPCPS